MSDIFREVDEALQREKAEKFWKEYGPTVLVAALMLVIGTAVGVAWRTWNHGANEQETARVVRALGSETSTQELKSVIGDSRDGPEAIALLTAAGQMQDNGDAAGAAALYKQAAESHDIPRDMRDLARIQYVRIAKDITPEQKLSVLKPVLDHDAGPFVWQARIEAALAQAQAEKYQQAIEYLAAFKPDNQELPPSLIERASALRQVYLAKTAKE